MKPKANVQFSINVYDNGEIQVRENGRKIEHLRSVEFKAAVDEVPTVKLEKHWFKKVAK